MPEGIGKGICDSHIFGNPVIYIKDSSEFFILIHFLGIYFNIEIII